MTVRWRVWVAIWAGWTGLALFLAAGASLTYLSTGRPANWRLTIAMAVAEWWAWAALTPLVAWLCRRWPLRPRQPLASIAMHVAVHLAAGLAIAFVKTAADRVVRGWITGFAPYFLISTVTFQFVIYCVLVTALHAVASHRRERERERTAAQLETSLAEARLELLRAQLHPHFLFNTLNAIAEFVHESPSKADRLITALGDLLREATNGRQLIALGAELALLRRYVEIQQARFEDRLDLRIDADPAAIDARVPSFLLQPIVENSIRHGLAGQLAAPPVAHAAASHLTTTGDSRSSPRTGAVTTPWPRGDSGDGRAARIAIEARRLGDRLRIDVRDSGAGLPEESAREGGAREGFGLRGTRARLQALYGERGRVTVGNAPHEAGALVTIEIPFEPIEPGEPIDQVEPIERGEPDRTGRADRTRRAD